jgi:hypothetical protein
MYPISDPDKPLVILWGDSHAAHHYPGLRWAAEVRQFRLASAARQSCPPVLDKDFPRAPSCRMLNDGLLKKLSMLKPDIVILAAAWMDKDIIPTEIISTIVRIKELGVRRVILFGPQPLWPKPLPILMFEAARANSNGRFPERLKGVITSQADDNVFRRVAERAGAEYISPLSIFCDLDGCLTKTGDDVLDITFWDNSHLTASGSYYLISHIDPEILLGPPH